MWQLAVQNMLDLIVKCSKETILGPSLPYSHGMVLLIGFLGVNDWGLLGRREVVILDHVTSLPPTVIRHVTCPATGGSWDPSGPCFIQSSIVAKVPTSPQGRSKDRKTPSDVDFHLTRSAHHLGPKIDRKPVWTGPDRAAIHLLRRSGEQ